MGAARFLTTNLITSESMLTVSSERAGQVGLAVKVGSGSATLSPGGPYTGTNPRQYIVEVNDVSAGTSVGTAKYRWRPADLSAWSASGVSTSATPTVLESGITVAWTSGGGVDFIAGDYWTITVDKPFGRRNLLDRDRDTEWRSADVATAVTLVADLGSAQAVDVVALCDHNLSAAATITIAGNAADAWGAPSLSEAITYQDNNVLRYLTTASRTYRYWRLSLTDAANPDGYIRLGELFLGSYVSLSRGFAPEWTRQSVAATYGPASALRVPRGVWATAEVIDLPYRGMTGTDRTAALALFAGLYDADAGTVKPFLFNLDSADAADISLYEFDQPELSISPQRALPTPLYSWRFRLRQRPRIARSGS